MDGSGFVLVLAGEGHGEAVDGEGEGAELDAALGLGGGPSVLGGEVVAEDEHLQLGQLVAGARVGPVPERHERVGLGGHLQSRTKTYNQIMINRIEAGSSNRGLL